MKKMCDCILYISFSRLLELPQIEKNRQQTEHRELYRYPKAGKYKQPMQVLLSFFFYLLEILRGIY